MAATKEIRVAPHIYQTPFGWRVYIRRGGILKPKRFPPEATLEQLQAFVDTFKEESGKLREQRRVTLAAHRGSFKADATTYLALKTVKAMPSFVDREREIGRWVQAFGARPRSAISARVIDEQLQAFRDSGLSGSTVNKLRTALMSLWTRLDGKSAANPVRDTMVFPEADELPRGQPYALLMRILDAVPNRGRPVKGKKGSTKAGSRSKARLEVMAWTGMAPVQIGRLTPAHLNLEERWYVTPRREKGKRTRFPRPVVRKRMSADAHAAFAQFVKLQAWGEFDRRALRHTWLRAVAKVEAGLREELQDPEFRLHVRLYDIRHSFGTEMYRVTQNRALVGDLLDHASERTTRRYALAAVSGVLEQAVAAFEKSATRGPAGNAFAPLPARAQPITGVTTRRRASHRAAPKPARSARQSRKK